MSRTALLVMWLAATAHADRVATEGAIAPQLRSMTVNDDKALPLIRALQWSGVKPATAPHVWSWKLRTVSCRVHLETVDRLGEFSCQLDGKKLTGAAAFVLYDALSATGLSGDHGSQETTYAAKDVACTDDLAARPVLTCTLTGR